MPRVQVLYAGGTIGMADSPAGRKPADGLLPRLRAAGGERLEALAAAGISWELETLDPLIDSAEASPQTWRELAQAVRAAAARADGIVVLHGTDTLAASGAALSFALRGLARPVVLTGAQHPLGDPGGDAVGNVLLAIRAAADVQLREVAIAFGGRLLRANRGMKWSTEAHDGFVSPNWPLLGEADAAGRLRLRPDALLDPDGTGAVALETVPMPAARPSIGVLRMHPGLEVDRFAAWLAVRPLGGLVLHTYGSGNAPVASTPLVRVVERCIADGTLVVNVTQCPHGRVHPGGYATATPLAAAGVVGAADMTLDCALAKLDWLCAHIADAATRARHFSTALCGEASF
jgi:L-asparaginase